MVKSAKEKSNLIEAQLLSKPAKMLLQRNIKVEVITLHRRSCKCHHGFRVIYSPKDIAFFLSIIRAPQRGILHGAADTVSFGQKLPALIPAIAGHASYEGENIRTLHISASRDTASLDIHLLCP